MWKHSISPTYSRKKKCGSISNAKKVFSMMICKNVLSWASMISGCGMNGYAHKAFELFDSMVHSGIYADHMVFVGLISACSHAGLVDEG